jgi:nicotinamide phosphoribosyltransferase
MKVNPITMTDSYKLSHWKQYPEGTESVFSYFESRSGAKFPETVFFGLQYFLKEYLVGGRLRANQVKEAKDLCDAHVGPGIFNEAGWLHVVNDHKGMLPIRIRAVPEGMVVPTSHALMTVENTCPKCFWMTNYLETLLVQVWYASTVATQSREMKKIILKYLDETGDPGLIDFKLHDFGFRGVSSVESAGTGGAAHLVNFKGTDTVRGLEVARDYYNGGICGFSIPAAEHSTMTSWGQEHEVDAMRNMLHQYPTGLVAVVSDSWDIYKAAGEIWGGSLKDLVLARDGCLVVRPDSGDPEKVVPEVMRILGEKLGAKKNDKGYIVLNPKVRMIQGDGIEFDTLGGILEAVKKAGFSADNLAFGSGGGLLQKLNRDTQRFAFKCSAVKVNGEWRDVFKKPATDPTKNSKPGRLTLLKTPEGFVTGPVSLLMDEQNEKMEALVTVFEDGKILKEWKFDEVRERAKI